MSNLNHKFELAARPVEMCIRDSSVCDCRAVGRSASDARSQERKSSEEKRCKVSAKTRGHVTVHKSDPR